MFWWKLPCLLIIISIIFANGKPLPKEDVIEGARRGRVLATDDKVPRIPERRSRQGFYDYFSYSYPFDYYKSPQYSDYTSFQFGSNYDAPAYNPRPSSNKPARKRYDKQRKQFEGTTQRWTIWDLARK